MDIEALTSGVMYMMKLIWGLLKVRLNTHIGTLNS